MGPRIPILTLKSFSTVCSDTDIEWSISDFKSDVLSADSNLQAFLRAEVTDVTCYHSEVGVSHEYLIMRVRPYAEDYLSLGSLIHMRCERHPGPFRGTRFFTPLKEQPPAKDTVRIRYDLSALRTDPNPTLISQTFHEGLQVGHVVDLLSIIHQEQPKYGLLSYNCWWFAAVSITTLHIFGTWTQRPNDTWGKRIVKSVGEKTSTVADKIMRRFLENWIEGDHEEVSLSNKNLISISDTAPRPIKRIHPIAPSSPPPPPSNTSSQSHPSYKSTRNTKITLLWRPDISRLQVSALVNSVKRDLLGGRGDSLDTAIHVTAGPKLYEECKTLGGADYGESKMTKGYNLHASYIIHTVGPYYDPHDPREARAKLALCYSSCLTLAAEHNLEDIAFPCISVHYKGFPLEEATFLQLHTIKEFLKSDSRDRIKHVMFMAFTEEELGVLQTQLPRYFPQTISVLKPDAHAAEE